MYFLIYKEEAGLNFKVADKIDYMDIFHSIFTYNLKTDEIVKNKFCQDGLVIALALRVIFSLYKKYLEDTNG